MNIIAQKLGINIPQIYKNAEDQCKHLKFNKIEFNNYAFDYCNGMINNSSFHYNKILFEKFIYLVNSHIKDSQYRKRHYHIKKKSNRVILTLFGEISININYYCDKETGKYTDLFREVMNWKKHDRYDPNLKAWIINKAATHSFSEIVRDLNEKTTNPSELPSTYISRQTVSTIVKSATFVDVEQKELRTVEKLYIMADEHFVGAQGNDSKPIMTKLVVVHEGSEFDHITGRRVLKNKRYITNITGSLRNQIDNFIYDTYDTNKIQILYKMGDGAGWIKSLFGSVNIPGVESVSALDKYHFKNALRRIFLDKFTSNLSVGYVLKDWKGFKELVSYAKETQPHRVEIIEAQYMYIKNNLKSIRNLYEHKLSCPMESQIHYILAKQLTQRPKGYSLKTLSSLLNIIERYHNKEDLKENYLYSYYNPEHKVLDQEHYTFNALTERKYRTITIADNNFRIIEKRTA